ncbi:MAG: ABC transporter ATP-binding protein [Nocardioidaceae bacterium]
MTELVVETTNLRKEYGTRRGSLVAVRDLSLAIPRGGVHGFLGPNGSGKTTTIRMLLGLARPSSGSMRLFGQDVPRRLPDVIDKVGAIVEQPKFFGSFTGRKNLTLLADTIGAPRDRVDKVIEEVGLTGRDRDRFKSYSLGMKQRLAIAAALLKQPQLLILDEPTNGLDPAGIREIREIRELGALGVSVLLSSHILAEVQQVCDHVSIIGRGRLLASGSVADVVGDTASGVRVGVADLGAGAAILERADLTVRRERDHLVVDHAADPAVITKVLAERGHFVHELTPVRADLESVFLELTGGEGPGDGPLPDQPARHDPADQHDPAPDHPDAPSPDSPEAVRS